MASASQRNREIEARTERKFEIGGGWGGVRVRARAGSHWAEHDTAEIAAKKRPENGWRREEESGRESYMGMKQIFVVKWPKVEEKLIME
jgi:hypothetical protein